MLGWQKSNRCFLFCSSFFYKLSTLLVLSHKFNIIFKNNTFYLNDDLSALCLQISPNFMYV